MVAEGWEVVIGAEELAVEAEDLVVGAWGWAQAGCQ